jgi:hypothetical protein
MTSELTNQLATQLLLLILTSVLAIGVVLSLFVVSYLKRQRSLGQPAPTENRAEERIHTLAPAAWCGGGRWLAIRSSNITAVQAALGLHHPTPCSWDAGLSKLTEQLFISPPVQGWILVFGQGLPDPAEDVDECFCLVQKLSRALGQVQFFNVNRAVHHHAWVRSEDGRIRRAYAWAGQTLWNQGSLTRAEIDLGVECFDYGETPGPIALSASESFQANADKVNALAARWSLDPAAIRESMVPVEMGIAGALIHSKLH